MDVHTSANKVIIFGILFVKKTDAIQIRPYGTLKEIVRLKIRTVGDLQRFAVEWYYQNILNQNFGGKEMAPYEVVLKNY